jgi:hypothetical protein
VFDGQTPPAATAPAETGQPTTAPAAPAQEAPRGGILDKLK